MPKKAGKNGPPEVQNYSKVILSRPKMEGTGLGVRVGALTQGKHGPVLSKTRPPRSRPLSGGTRTQSLWRAETGDMGRPMDVPARVSSDWNVARARLGTSQPTSSCCGEGSTIRRKWRMGDLSLETAISFQNVVC